MHHFHLKAAFRDGIVGAEDNVGPVLVVTVTGAFALHLERAVELGDHGRLVVFGQIVVDRHRVGCGVVARTACVAHGKGGLVLEIEIGNVDEQTVAAVLLLEVARVVGARLFVTAVLGSRDGHGAHLGHEVVDMRHKAGLALVLGFGALLDGVGRERDGALAHRDVHGVRGVGVGPAFGNAGTHGVGACVRGLAACVLAVGGFVVNHGRCRVDALDHRVVDGLSVVDLARVVQEVDARVEGVDAVGIAALGTPVELVEAPVGAATRQVRLDGVGARLHGLECDKGARAGVLMVLDLEHLLAVGELPLDIGAGPAGIVPEADRERLTAHDLLALADKIYAGRHLEDALVVRRRGARVVPVSVAIGRLLHVARLGEHVVEPACVVGVGVDKTVGLIRGDGDSAASSLVCREAFDIHGGTVELLPVAVLDGVVAGLDGRDKRAAVDHDIALVRPALDVERAAVDTNVAVG